MFNAIGRRHASPSRDATNSPWAYHTQQILKVEDIIRGATSATRAEHDTQYKTTNQKKFGQSIVGARDTLGSSTRETGEDTSFT